MSSLLKARESKTGVKKSVGNYKFLSITRSDWKPVTLVKSRGLGDSLRAADFCVSSINARSFLREAA
jgi:hypothetical protein